MEWNVARGGRHCCKCEKEFREEEVYFSALWEHEDSYERKDYCAECWPQVERSDAFCFWRTRRPASEAPQKMLVDDDVIYDFFQRLAEEESEAKRNFRYVLGLLLMRRKLLRLVDIRSGSDKEMLVLKNRKDGLVFEVPDPALTQMQIEEVTEQLTAVLNMDFS